MTRWNQTELFPQMVPLHIRLGGDTPKTRRLQLMKTRYTKPKCRVCRDVATHYSTLHKRYVCREHLSAEDRKRLTVAWQWANIILPIQRHLQLHGRG